MRDLTRLTAFIAEKRPKSAKRANKAIRAGIKLLSKHPESGQLRSPRFPNIRQWTLSFGRSAYLILYRHEGHQIMILAIQHGREDRQSDEAPD